MSNVKPLAVKQLVWAKVEPYPWWPAKIAQIVRQNNKDIYKISFFAEPTYAYLLQHQLVRYQQFDQALNLNFAVNTLHHIAVNMADTYFTSMNMSSTVKSSQESIKQHFQQVALPLEEPIYEKEEVITQNLMVPEEFKAIEDGLNSKVTSQVETRLNTDEISGDNVIFLIENNGKKQKKCDYSYETRKEEIRYQDKLKEELLKKYNLLYIGKENEATTTKIKNQKTIIQITQPLIHRKMTKKIQKNKLLNSASNNQISVLKVRCLRKLTQLLKNQQDSFQTTKCSSLQIINRILLLSDNNHMKLKSLVITLMKTVSRCAAKTSCEQKLSQFSQYLERMENEKHQDQEGSRLTQIEALVN